MSKLTAGSVQMNKQLERKQPKTFSFLENDIPSTIASSKVASALTDKIGGKKKAINLTVMNNYVPRDDKMYTQNQLFKNIELDNTKEEREEEQKRKNDERRKRVHMRTQNRYSRQFFLQGDINLLGAPRTTSGA